MVAGQTPKWPAAAVSVMFLDWRRGRRSAMPGMVTVLVRQRNISRAMARFRSLMTSFFVRPAVVCRATYARVRESLDMRTRAMR